MNARLVVLAIFVVVLTIMTGVALFSRTASATSAQHGIQVAQATEEAPAPQKGGPTKTTTEQFAGWAMRCTYVGEDRQCVLMQRLLTKDRKNLLAAAIVALAKGGGAELILQVPTGVEITPGLELDVDGKAAGTAQYRACAIKSCEAMVPLDRGLLGKLAAGKSLTITIASIRGKKLKIPMPLDSFTEAYTAFQKAVTKTN